MSSVIRYEGSMPSRSRSKCRQKRYWRIASSHVPVREMHADQRTVRAFAERLACDTRKTCVERLAEPAGTPQPIAQRVERPQAELPEAFVLDQDEVVVPVGEHVAREQRRGDVADIGEIVVEPPARERLGLVKIDVDVEAETEPLIDRLDDADAAAVEPPENRPQIGGGALVG